MVSEAERLGIHRIGMPHIVAGLGGLPWDDVKAVLVIIGAGTQVELVMFEEYRAPRKP